MAGTTEGGRKAAITNQKRYGKAFYEHIGRKGGKLGTTGGFASNLDHASRSGAKGGTRSKRGYRFVEETATKLIYISLKTNETVEFNK